MTAPYEISYETAELILSALRKARDGYVSAAYQTHLQLDRCDTNDAFKPSLKEKTRHACYQADSLTVEIERLDAYLKEHKPTGKKGRRK